MWRIPALSLVALLSACSAQRPIADDTVISRQRDLRELAFAHSAEQITGSEELKVPVSEPLRYPDNWPDIVAIRDRQSP